MANIHLRCPSLALILCFEACACETEATQIYSYRDAVRHSQSTDPAKAMQGRHQSAVLPQELTIGPNHPWWPCRLGGLFRAIGTATWDS